jgi:hypothetical protein
MATTFQLTVTPDATLSISPIVLSTTLDDPADFTTFLQAHQSMLNLPGDALPAAIVGAWTESILQGTMNNIAGWIKAQRVAAVTVTVPDLPLTVDG